MSHRALSEHGNRFGRDGGDDIDVEPEADLINVISELLHRHVRKRLPELVIAAHPLGRLNDREADLHVCGC